MLNTKLKIRRQELGLKQVDVADKAGVTVTSYLRYEKGQRVPNATTAILIAKALNSTVEELF